MDKRIPHGSEIKTVDMLYKIANSNLEGVRFLDKDMNLLLVVGWNNDLDWHKEPYY